ncbi:hypothetical protein NHX12_009974 [Muraenolepis orangiensis]|uniref:Uncharacterized protein n=1 Tax=Muraenolepis orangiensis TaxID=630683 RepID=A0A9Q0DK89_9TELE|nr:hypothetical protein NHX12_009974 [Muraenolepis orangiensis]
MLLSNSSTHGLLSGHGGHLLMSTFKIKPTVHAMGTCGAHRCLYPQHEPHAFLPVQGRSIVATDHNSLTTRQKGPEGLLTHVALWTNQSSTGMS